MKVIVLDNDADMTSPYGERSSPIPGIPSFHRGADFGVYKVPVKAARNGTVVYTGYDTEGGNWILLQHDDGSGSRYFHLDSISVYVGQRVIQGQTVLGISGNTGQLVTGYHLHFEWLLNWNDINSHVNPLSYIAVGIGAGNTTTMNTDFITVQPGWGLSHVAVAAGLPAVEATYQLIYSLNAGWRGSTDWQSLNARMGAGDMLKVRATTQTPQVQDIELQTALKDKETLATKNQELLQTISTKESEIQKLTQQKAGELLEQKTQLENEKTKALQEITTAKDAEIAELNQQLEALQQVGITYNFPVNVGGVIVAIVEETSLVDKLLKKWKAFVSSKFGRSQILDSLFSYDIFVILGSEAVAQIFLNFILGLNLPAGLGATIGTGATIVKQLLTNRFDSNKDGKLDITDTMVLKNYYDPNLRGQRGTPQ